MACLLSPLHRGLNHDGFFGGGEGEQGSQLFRQRFQLAEAAGTDRRIIGIQDELCVFRHFGAAILHKLNGHVPKLPSADLFPADAKGLHPSGLVQQAIQKNTQ